PQRIYDELVVGPLGALNRYQGGQPGNRVSGPAAGDLDRVGVGRAVDDDGVGLAVARAAAGRARQIEVHASYVGARQVVDGEVVGAAQGHDVDLLHAVDIHRHVTDVARQPQPAAVGRQVEVLADVRAVELQGVLVALNLDDVAGVARVPDERVVAGAPRQAVVAAAADDDVVAVATQQHVVAVAASDGVIARAAVHSE